MKKRLRQAVCLLMLWTLLAAALPAGAAAAGFEDVPDGYWAEEDILRSVQMGVFQEESSGLFGVDSEISRSGFVVSLCRFLGWKPTVPARVIYQDVPASLWYAGAIEAAYNNGAITAQTEMFRPDDPITREEAAVMLVRALGYGAISGLIQDLPLPFEDVSAAGGYITMAYGLGLMDGTSATEFSPKETITRAQGAVMLMRLYDKLTAASSRVGIVSSEGDLPDLSGYEAVAVSAARLVYNGLPQLSEDLDEETVAAARAAAKSAGAKQLLYVTGTQYQLREECAQEMAEVLLEAVKEGAYDGLFLDISGLNTNTHRKALNAVVEMVRADLGAGKRLYVMVEAPSWHGGVSGYDYAVLGELADRLVLRLYTPADTSGAIPAAPMEPLEEIYYALNRMRGVVDAEKLSVLLTSTGSVWTDAEEEPAAGREIAKMLESRNTQSHYSGRYACAYLENDEMDQEPRVVWYLNGQSVQERTRLMLLFGVGNLCISELGDALPEVAEIP